MFSQESCLGSVYLACAQPGESTAIPARSRLLAMTLEKIRRAPRSCAHWAPAIKC